jgi:hypothetical protein
MKYKYGVWLRKEYIEALVGRGVCFLNSLVTRNETTFEGAGTI